VCVAGGLALFSCQVRVKRKLWVAVGSAVTTHHNGLLYCEGIPGQNRQRATEGKRTRTKMQKQNPFLDLQSLRPMFLGVTDSFRVLCRRSERASSQSSELFHLQAVADVTYCDC
jgi:hypothetical protein